MRITITFKIILLINIIVGTAIANATQITFTPVVIGLALDTEFDGIFETVEDRLADNYTAIGRVLNSSFFNSERRAILEFDISPIPAKGTIKKANLTLNWDSSSNITPSTNIYGFIGNGFLDQADAVETSNLLADGLSTLIEVDITSFMQDLIDNSESYAGFLGVETINNANRNYGYFVLEIEYIPEPATILLLGLGGLLLHKRK